MKPNTMSGLRDTLFNTIEKLKSGEIRVDQANSINSIAQSLISSVKVEIDYMKLSKKVDSQFLSIDDDKKKELRQGE